MEDVIVMCMCVPMPTHCTITRFRFRTRQIDGVKCGLFLNHALLGQATLHWDEYVYSVLDEKKKFSNENLLLPPGI